MLTIFALLLAGAAPTAAAPAETPSATANDSGPHGWKCSTGRNRLREQESRETWDAIKRMKKDGGAGVPPEAQKILNQITEMYEQDDSRGSSDMAELMREFAGGKAERRTAC
jgi:Spy/CpxP family protein refolding chaperone